MPRRPAPVETPVEHRPGEALVWTDGACSVTDSQLVLDSMTTWIAGWKRKGWRTAGGQPVKNRDLVQALDAEIGRHEAVRWHWVRGHETGAEHAHKALNDRADRLGGRRGDPGRGA